VDLTHGLLGDSGQDYSYMAEAIPRALPPLNGTNITWQPGQDYFTGSMDTLSSGYNMFFTANATFPGNHTYMVTPVCRNSTTSQLWFRNATRGEGTEIFSSFLIGYPDPSCHDWFSLVDYPEIEQVTDQSFFNQKYLSDSQTYECVSQNIYQWVFYPFYPSQNSRFTSN